MSHTEIPLKTPINNPSRHDRMTLFTAYAENPLGVSFETQQEEEHVILFMRQHFILNVPWIGATFLLLAAPFVLIPFTWTFIDLPIVIPGNYTLVGLLFWYLATLGYILLNFIRWYYNIYIVTTKRIIDIDFVQLLYKKFSEARLDNIEDVTYTMSGFFATTFNYGDVAIQTAAETTQFEFTDIPRPAHVVETISRLVGKEQTKHGHH